MTNLPKIKPKLREDLQLREWAKDNGWKEQLHRADRSRLKRPQLPLAWLRDDKNIWFCHLGWAAAETAIDTAFKPRRYYPTLVEAFTKET